MTRREFLGEDVWKAWNLDYEALMSFRKTIKGTPDQYQRAMIELYRPWIAFYKQVL